MGGQQQAPQPAPQPMYQQQAPMYHEPVYKEEEVEQEASTVDELVHYETGFMGKEAANVNAPDDDDESEDDDDDGPAASSSDGPGTSSSGQRNSSSDSGTESADNPQASASSSDGPGPESMQSSSASFPDSLQSSSAQSSGPDGSSSDAYMRKIALKKGAQSRYMMYLLCNMLEQSGREMLRYAMDNPSERRDALDKRQLLMDSLYNLRHLSDVDDDFTHDEFEKEMIQIKSARTKVQRLAMKQSDDNPQLLDKDSNASSSSDEDHNKDYQEETDVLKDARAIMEFTFGKQKKGGEYILPSGKIGGSAVQRQMQDLESKRNSNQRADGEAYDKTD